jgi:hypothetical protein
MFNVITILITYILDRQGLLSKVRSYANIFFLKYVRIFIKTEFSNQRHIRYAYLFTIIPIIIFLIFMNIILHKLFFANYIFDMFIFMLTVDMLRWKLEIQKNDNNNSFIIAYATKFFVPIFWFIFLPYGIGSTCYLIIMLLSIELKNKIADSVVYNTVVDKMLFYINLVPYFILFFFISVASNFENIAYHILSERKKLNKSFYLLNNLLSEIILIAIDDNKFKNIIDNDDIADAGLDMHDNLKVHSDQYVIAILYRTGIFFVGTYSIIQFFRFIEFLIN